MTRQEQVAQELRQVVHTLAAEYGAERVILFGSAARGSIGDDSDVDLVVIKNTSLPFFDRLKEVAAVCRWRYAFDVLVYTPEEFDEMRRSNPFIRDEVVKNGKVLYERAA